MPQNARNGYGGLNKTVFGGYKSFPLKMPKNARNGYGG